MPNLPWWAWAALGLAVIMYLSKRGEAAPLGGASRISTGRIGERLKAGEPGS